MSELTREQRLANYVPSEDIRKVWCDVGAAPGEAKDLLFYVERIEAENEALRKGPSVEAIADALYAHDALTHHWSKPWEGVANWERETYLDRARAVKRALGREPE